MEVKGKECEGKLYAGSLGVSLIHKESSASEDNLQRSGYRLGTVVV